jgi:hypothetical protein
MVGFSSSARVHADRQVRVGIFLAELVGVGSVLETSSGNEKMCAADLMSPLDDRVAIIGVVLVAELFVSEIGSDIKKRSLL